ncbi:hypothetical protein [Acidithiobacillus caldus]|uniref:hypothetical protein n=1 Tax=Acidithiobacillus caldus TaxID=33059 RepID=UPI001C07EAD3|nr:hypothetical protein [Acidithiobacillus caldus]MBU2771594.1 hypothetical protein [Acidithiobacillus caldus]
MSTATDLQASQKEVMDFVDAFAKQVREHGQWDRPSGGQIGSLGDDVVNLKDNITGIQSGMETAGDALEKGRKPLFQKALDRLQESAKSLSVNLAAIGKQTRAMVKDRVPGAEKIARAFDDVLDATKHYTTLGMQRLSDLAQGRSNEDRYALGFAAGHLQSAQDVALEQRKKGIVASLKSPNLGEYALADAKRLGMLGENRTVHRGTVLNVIGNKVIIKNVKGQLLALPVKSDFAFKTGDNVVMRERDGAYSGKRQVIDRGMER